MIKLVDIIEIINENNVIEIYNEESELIAEYDGRESIPEDYDEYYVDDIYAYFGKLVICINTHGEVF